MTFFQVGLLIIGVIILRFLWNIDSLISSVLQRLHDISIDTTNTSDHTGGVWNASKGILDAVRRRDDALPRRPRRRDNRIRLMRRRPPNLSKRF